jgi:hypothetical protein
MAVLYSHWAPVKTDHATAAGVQQLINPAAFTAVRAEGDVMDEPYLEFGRVRSAPLWLYFSGARSDHRTVARPQSIAQAQADGYIRRALVGHVFPYEPRFAAIPLRQYWHPERADTFLLGTTASEAAAAEAGYTFTGVEGWAARTPTLGYVLSSDRWGGPRLRYARYTGGWTDLINDAVPRRGIEPFPQLPVHEPSESPPQGYRFHLPVITFGHLKAGDILRDQRSSTGWRDDVAHRDVITVTEEPLPGMTTDIEIVLRLGPTVTWWKRVALVDAANTVVAAREVEGAGSVSNPIRITARQSIDRYLVFSKAKLLGVRVRQYQLLDISSKQGMRLTFDWVRDDEPLPRQNLTWQAMDTHVDPDLFRLRVGSGTPGQMTVQVSNTRKSRWWKKVSVLAADRSVITAVEIDGADRSAAALSVSNDQLPGARLLLSRAGFLGLRHDLYEVGDLTVMGDRFVSLEWLRDDLPYAGGPMPFEWRPGYRIHKGWTIYGFARTQCDGDIIRPVVEDLPPGDEQMMEFVIELGGPVSWWKGLRLYNIFDDLITDVTVEGAGARSAPLRGRWEDFWGGHLLFAKAKFLGLHEDKYDFQLDAQSMTSIGARPGKRVVFRWIHDDYYIPEGCD